MLRFHAAGRIAWTRGCACAVLTIALGAAAATIARAQTQNKPVPPVAAAELQKLLPAIDGWTSGVARADQVELSPEAKYSFASVTLTKGDFRLKLQLADSGFHPDILLVIATMVATMPEGYSGEVSGATIKRTVMAGSPSAESWYAEKSTGEITVVVGGRFVASIEASKADSLETLRGILAKVDFKALAALK
jgi:hypothetical protein